MGRSRRLRVHNGLGVDIFVRYSFTVHYSFIA
jgi:hypothetical protein